MNVFSRNPVKILVKRFENKQIITTRTYVLLNVPQNIYNEVIKISNKPAKSSILDKYFGENWDVKLNISLRSGGNDEIDDEISELEELLEDVSTPESEVSSAIEIGGTQYINDVFVFPEDRISEFKDKVHLITGIPMFRQHMYVMKSGKPLPMRYRTLIDGITDINITELYSGVSDLIHGVPIDSKFNNNRDEIRIEAYDELRTMGEIFNVSTKFHVVDLNLFWSRA